MKINIKWLCIASGIILLLAILNWPYGYYVLLRLAIFISAIIVAYSFYNSNVFAWALIFGAMAFLFNPIFPIYLTRSAWIPIDFISSVLFFIAAFSEKK